MPRLDSPPRREIYTCATRRLVAEFHYKDDEPVHEPNLVLPLDDFVLHDPDDYRAGVFQIIAKRKQAAHIQNKLRNAHPGTASLVEYDETQPEPF